MLMGQIFEDSTASDTIKSAYLLAYGDKDLSGEPAVMVVGSDGYPACFARAGSDGRWLRHGYTHWLHRAGDVVWFEEDYVKQLIAEQIRWRDEISPAAVRVPCTLLASDTYGDCSFTPISGRNEALLELSVSDLRQSSFGDPGCYDELAQSSKGLIRSRENKRSAAARHRETNAVGNCSIRLWRDAENPVDRPYISSLFSLDASKTRRLCAPVRAMMLDVTQPTSNTGAKGFVNPDYKEERLRINIDPAYARHFVGNALCEMEDLIRDKSPALVCIRERQWCLAFMTETTSWYLDITSKGELETSKGRPFVEEPEIFADEKNIVRMDMPEEVWRSIDAQLVAVRV